MHPYFLPKTGEHDVTLMSFTADLSKPWKIPLVKVYEFDEGGDMQSLVAISPFIFNNEKKSGGEGGASAPIGTWVKEQLKVLTVRAMRSVPVMLF